MKITKRQLRRIIKEAQWGNFTGGAAPLDMPMRDSGPVPKDQLRKMADIFMNDMGMSPEEVLEKPEFVEQGITDLKQLEENKVKITKRQLRRIIREGLLKEAPDEDNSYEGFTIRQEPDGTWLGFRTDHGRPHRYPNHPTKESLFKVIDRHVQRAMGYQGDDAK